MSVLALTALSILLGVLATIFVGKYYFTKTVATRLTPYLLFAAPVFRGIDPVVRKQLQVLYNGTPVEELSQLQFVIVNDGERSIRDCIEPLCLTLPEGVSVLDASILYVHPQGRKVDIQVSDQPGRNPSVKFPFALLNKGEGFAVKMLLRGKVSRKNLHFAIVADDLPPILSIERWWPRSSEGRGGYQFGILRFSTVGLMPLLVGGCGLYLTYLFFRTRPDLVPIPWSTFKYSWSLIPLALGLLWSMLLFLIGLDGCLWQFRSSRVNRHTKGPHFPLPPAYRPSWDLLSHFDEEDVSSEGKPPPEEKKGTAA